MMPSMEADQLNELVSSATGWVDTGQWVIHQPTGVVGVAKALYRPGEWSPPDGEKVDAHVLELQNGHAFLLKPEVWGATEAFRLLSEAEVAFYIDAVSITNHAAQELMKVAQSLKLEFPAAKALLGDALQALLLQVRSAA